MKKLRATHFDKVYDWEFVNYEVNSLLKKIIGFLGKKLLASD